VILFSRIASFIRSIIFESFTMLPSIVTIPSSLILAGVALSSKLHQQAYWGTIRFRHGFEYFSDLLFSKRSCSFVVFLSSFLIIILLEYESLMGDFREKLRKTSSSVISPAITLYSFSPLHLLDKMEILPEYSLLSTLYTFSISRSHHVAGAN